MSMSEDAMIKVIENAGVSLISSIDEYGFPNTKAMLPPRERHGIKEFFFSTNTSSLRVSHYRINNKACLYFYNKRFFQGVMIVGEMRVLEDQETKNRIWRDGDDLYYSLGITDPDYCVLKFIGHKIRTYHNFKKETLEI